MTLPVEQLSFIPTNANTKRNLGDWGGDVLNVKNFNAKGDGVNDDTAAIQLAVSTAVSLNTNLGAELYFPPGDYLINAPIVIGFGSIRIRGASRPGTKIRTTMQGYVFTQQGILNAGGSSPSSINITGVADSGAPNHNIRLTVTGTAASLVTAVAPAYGVANNTPYTVAGITGTGPIGSLNGTQKFIIVDATHLDVIGSAWGGGGTLTSNGGGGNITGGTQGTKLRIEAMTIENALQAPRCGAVYIGYSEKYSSIDDCELSGYVGADVASCDILGGSFGVGISNCYITNGNVTVGNSDKSNVPYVGMPPGSTGVILGEGIMTGCRIQAFEVGVAMSGVAPNVVGCSIERCNTAIFVGLRNDGSFPMQGGAVTGIQTEACTVAYWLNSISGGLFSSSILTCSVGTGNSVNIQTASYSGGLITVTSIGPHNLGAPGTVQCVTLNIIPSAFTSGTNAGNTRVTVVNPTQFQYIHTDPLAVFSSGFWTIGPSAAIYPINVSNCIFAGLNTSNFFSVFGTMDMSTTSGQHKDNVVYACDLASGVTVPIGTNKASWDFRNCGNFVGPATMQMHFADLPGGSGVQETRQEGQEYNIIDGDATITFGHPEAAGGTTHKKVRWNGTSWTVCGV